MKIIKNFKKGDMMHDLKELDDKFHEFLKSGLNEKDYDFDEI